MKSESLPCIFYDGTCGFCHFFVRFTVLHMDLEKPLFFSPLGGKKFQQVTRDRPIDPLPDSLIVFNPASGAVLFKGEGVIFILNRLGKRWKGVATLLKILPLKLVNWGYDCFAKSRHKVSKKTASACPVVPKHLRQFFED